jgi:hypothetical protein
MTTVYLETTIPSYLAAYASRDLVVAAHQQVTADWWRSARRRFSLFVSETVLAEIAVGDPEAAARRMQIVNGLPVLVLNDDVRFLVDEYERRLGLPEQGRADLPHIAFAVAYEMDYLVTWNCRHIANGEVVRRLMDVNTGLGRWTPLIVTPEEISPSSEEEMGL